MKSICIERRFFDELIKTKDQFIDSDTDMFFEGMVFEHVIILLPFRTNSGC